MGHIDTRLAILALSRSAGSLGLDHFLARTSSQTEAIYRLRYDAYRSEGLIAENRDGLLHDRYDYEGDSSIFGVTMQGRLVSTIRLSLLSRTQKACATYAAFKDYLDPFVACGQTVADGSRLAVRCENSAARRSVILYTLSLAVAFSSRFSADYGAISVRESHVPFYERYGFDLLSAPRPYNAMVVPLSLMMITLPKPSATSRLVRSGNSGHAIARDMWV
jgi:hypothetical protein